jgi:hypothetical protein
MVALDATLAQMIDQVVNLTAVALLLIGAAQATYGLHLSLSILTATLPRMRHGHDAPYTTSLLIAERAASLR